MDSTDRVKKAKLGEFMQWHAIIQRLKFIINNVKSGCYFEPRKVERMML